MHQSKKHKSKKLWSYRGIPWTSLCGAKLTLLAVPQANGNPCKSRESAKVPGDLPVGYQSSQNHIQGYQHSHSGCRARWCTMTSWVDRELPKNDAHEYWNHLMENSPTIGVNINWSMYIDEQIQGYSHLRNLQLTAAPKFLICSNDKPSCILVNELQQMPNMQKAPGTVFHTSFIASRRWSDCHNMKAVPYSAHMTTAQLNPIKKRKSMRRTQVH